MNTTAHYHVAPVVRQNFDFNIEKMSHYWFANDPFRTRVFDAISILFPDGERYFIESVRKFRAEIQDPKLQQAVTDFIKQEAQHSIAHTKMNDVTESYGLPVTQIVQKANHIFEYMTHNFSPRFNLAVTAASEHLTALMAESFFSKQEIFADADPYVRALFAWHAIEEMEHRDVAYDVMLQVGNVPEWMRKFSLVFATLNMFGVGLLRTNEMLRYDGFSTVKRTKMFIQGLPWFFGGQGVLTKHRREYLAWFKTGFHPSQQPIIHQYDIWVKVLQETQDPIKAGEAFWQAGY